MNGIGVFPEIDDGGEEIRGLDIKVELEVGNRGVGVKPVVGDEGAEGRDVGGKLEKGGDGVEGTLASVTDVSDPGISDAEEAPPKLNVGLSGGVKLVRDGDELEIGGLVR